MTETSLTYELDHSRKEGGNHMRETNLTSKLSPFYKEDGKHTRKRQRE